MLNSVTPAPLAPIEMEILLRFFCAKDCNEKLPTILLGQARNNAVGARGGTVAGICTTAHSF